MKRSVSNKKKPVSTDSKSSEFPVNLAKPALRALERAGFFRLKQLTKVSASTLMKLHGMGPKALDQLRKALAAQGLSFANQKKED
jgi:DNA-directed RNA polymerase alpha subunit